MAQPNSGRIGRSPGAVARMSRMASSTSCSPLTRAIPPVGPIRRGNDQPEPTNCSAIREQPAFLGNASPQARHGDGRDLEDGGLDLEGRADDPRHDGVDLDVDGAGDGRRGPGAQRRGAGRPQVQGASRGDSDHAPAAHVDHAALDAERAAALDGEGASGAERQVGARVHRHRAAAGDLDGALAVDGDLGLGAVEVDGQLVVAAGDPDALLAPAGALAEQVDPVALAVGQGVPYGLLLQAVVQGHVALGLHVRRRRGRRSRTGGPAPPGRRRPAPRRRRPWGRCRRPPRRPSGRCAPSR
ncbi:hypothetical protein SVIOM342S_05439 [Streptomyces violaceorubidus]